MKKLLKILFIVSVVLSFSSCAFHNGYINSSASLSQANFNYVNKNISGSASTLQFLAIGGLNRQAIVAKAKENMLKDNPLKPNQTLVNITINWKRGFYILIFTNKCTITADVVEFYSNDKERKLRTKNINSETKDDPLDFQKTNNKANDDTNNNIQEDYYGFKIGDKVIFKIGFSKYEGEITEFMAPDSFKIKYINKKEKIAYIVKEYIWVKKIE